MIRSTLLRILLLAPAVGVLTAATPQPMLTFQSVFAGVAADRQHCMWEGVVDGAVRGRLTIALRQVGEPAAAANPVWHVASRWTVSDNAGARSFAANLEGMVDWKAGTTRLAGVVTDGWLRGSWVELDGRIVNGDLVGSLSILPALATP